MNQEAFVAQADELKERVLSTIRDFFKERGVDFSLEGLIDHTSIDFEQLSREAHFYGADLYPVVE